MRETLSTTRTSEYFELHGLTTLTRLTSNRRDKAIVKELLDNALDAIYELDTKELWLDVGDDGFTILDNGPRIAEADLDKIFDFNLFVSRKWDFRVATRGAQGNALKVINWVRQRKEDTPRSLYFNRKMSAVRA